MSATLEEIRDRAAEHERELQLLFTGKARRALKKTPEAKAARILAREKRECRRESTQLRIDRDRIAAEIRELRAAAHREPLPKPDGYVAPPLDPSRVLCDALTPAEVIYALVDPADPELVRYVGRTSDPVNRYRTHCTAGSDAVVRWVRALAADGRSPVMLLIERCAAATVHSREKHWINHYYQRFQADLNVALPSVFSRG